MRICLGRHRGILDTVKISIAGGPVSFVFFGSSALLRREIGNLMSDLEPNAPREVMARRAIAQVPGPHYRRWKELGDEAGSARVATSTW